MTCALGARECRDIPTFSECVLGYRAWHTDPEDRLWPLFATRRPWLPGINTARCNCRTANSLQFEWSWHDGGRILEPAPQHPAPEQDCVCGLYSWRRPAKRWYEQSDLSSPPRVIGAVASWARIQVHDAGFRAEHACVVTLAHHEEVFGEPLRKLKRVAAHLPSRPRSDA